MRGIIGQIYADVLRRSRRFSFVLMITLSIFAPLWFTPGIQTDFFEIMTIQPNQIKTHRYKRLPKKVSILDIAVHLAYSNQNYMFKMFKDIVGMTPTEYRKMNP